MPARRSSSIARSAWPRSAKTAIKVARSVVVMRFLLSEDLATKREPLASSSRPLGQVNPCQRWRSVLCRAFLFETSRGRDSLPCCSSRCARYPQSVPGNIACMPYPYHGAEAQRVLRLLPGGEESALHRRTSSPGVYRLVSKLHQATLYRLQYLEERMNSSCSASFALPRSSRQVNRLSCQ